MGGLIRSQTVRGDLWMIEGGGTQLAAYPVMTTSEGPGPRVGHASLLVGNAFIGSPPSIMVFIEELHELHSLTSLGLSQYLGATQS